MENVPLERKCARCGKPRDPSFYAIITKGKNIGKINGTCSTCLDVRKDYNQQKRVEQPLPKSRAQEAMPIQDISSFLASLSRTGMFDSRARVDVGEAWTAGVEGEAAAKKGADRLAAVLSERTRYRWVYHGKKVDGDRPDRLKYSYHCAQNESRQEAPKKKPGIEEDKRRDKMKMVAFPCHGWLQMTVNTAEPNIIAMHLKHDLDHVPYCDIYLPESWRVKITDEAITKDVSQLWNEILQHYAPKRPDFSRQAVYAAWSEAHSQQWRLKEDQMESAIELLKRAEKDGSSPFKFERIPIDAPEGYEVFAFALSDILGQWGGRIREIAIDSTWNTTGSNFELYAVLGEAYGSGLPLAYLLVRSPGSTEGGEMQHIIEQYLRYLAEKYNLEIACTLSDKNWPEINSCRSVFPRADHQLCYWHVLKAIKKRLSILRRQPAYYNVKEATDEFPWIDKTFLPMSQRTDGKTQADLYMAQNTVPTIRIRLGGQLLTPQIPGSRKTPLGDSTNTTSSDVIGPSLTGADTPSSIPTWPQAEKADTTWEDLEPEEQGIMAEMEEVLFGKEADAEDMEDAPDWDCEKGETTSKDKTYVFTPAPHRHQLLRIVTRAFCRHAIFPNQNGQFTPEEIRERAVHEMYTFCHARGLTETWAYFWTNWYSPSRWHLWARSSSGERLSRLRTTMTAENHFGQLKGDYLHFLHRPRLDHAVWVIIKKVTPDYMARAGTLEDTHRLGRARALTPFQRGFKASWKKKYKLPVSDKPYTTDIKRWVCDCGSQELDTYHCCKHLVQGVPKPPPEFFSQVVRRRVVPLYRHSALYPKGETPSAGKDGGEPDGSVSDGDDHVWLGDKAKLANGGWRELEGKICLKRRLRVESDEDEGLGLDGGRAKVPRTVMRVDDDSSDGGLVETESASHRNPSSGSSRGITASRPIAHVLSSSSDDEMEDRAGDLNYAQDLAEDLESLAAIIRKQLPYKNPIWLRGIRNGIGAKISPPIKTTLEDIRKHEKNGRGVTWPRNPQEARASSSTMGYHII